MKSKSLDLKRSSSERMKQNKTFDFTTYYKSAAETKTTVENTKGTTENINKENKLSKSKNGTPTKSERTPNKKKNKLEPLDISHIDIEGPSLDTSAANGTPLNESKVTSTPQASSQSEPKMKSIMKNKSLMNEQYLDGSYNASSKSKKRNKSVSFMLDDAEEVVVKKTKSNESIEKKTEITKKSSREIMKAKKNKDVKKDVSGKENKREDNLNSETAPAGKKKDKSKVKTESMNDTPKDSPITSKEEKPISKKGKFKKLKKQNSDESMDVPNESNNNENHAENKNRKANKKKHSPKVTQRAEGEPAAKAQKVDDKPEAIVEDLESLSIGDNAHTLTNLLDEMTVVDKDKKKKNKEKFKKEKKASASAANSESADLEKIEEGKEKIKWKKRKWNKDKKGEADDESSTSVIVDNLPLSMVCNYKKLLADQFGKHGLIKKIGVAEVYPTEVSKPVFTTSIQFYTETSAAEALAEDQSEVEGSRVCVRRALPASETTLVVRSYGEMSDQSVSSVFAAAGRIRAIRHLVKGKKAIATAFVEFDGPDALQRALVLAADAGARIAGKRLHAARFLPRPAAPPPHPAPLPHPAPPRDSDDSDH